jgi:hypothetical protein
MQLTWPAIEDAMRGSALIETAGHIHESAFRRR